MKKAFDPSKGYIDPDFCRWAFGVELNDPIFSDAIQLMKLWNNRHGGELMLTPDGLIEHDVARMGVIWEHEGCPDGREMVG